MPYGRVNKISVSVKATMSAVRGLVSCEEQRRDIFFQNQKSGTNFTSKFSFFFRKKRWPNLLAGIFLLD
jgi:hypothetical protein